MSNKTIDEIMSGRCGGKLIQQVKGGKIVGGWFPTIGGVVVTNRFKFDIDRYLNTRKEATSWARTIKADYAQTRRN